MNRYTVGTTGRKQKRHTCDVLAPAGTTVAIAQGSNKATAQAIAARMVHMYNNFNDMYRGLQDIRSQVIDGGAKPDSVVVCTIDALLANATQVNIQGEKATRTK